MTVQTLAIVVLLVSFFVMIFLRFPIAYAVGHSTFKNFAFSVNNRTSVILIYVQCFTSWKSYCNGAVKIQ